MTEERRQAFAHSTGIDLWLTQRALAAGFELGTLYAADASGWVAPPEKLFAERLAGSERGDRPDPRIWRVTGLVGTRPETLVRVADELVAVAVGAITLFVATTAAFAISRLRVRGGRTVLNMALFTYFIPAAFLAVPMYKTMGNYGLLNSQWALILAMVTIASPYCIWVLKQASDKLPYELDEAARMDGASPLQLFRLVYLPLMVPSLVAVARTRCCWPGTSTSTPSCCCPTTRA